MFKNLARLLDGSSPRLSAEEIDTLRNKALEGSPEHQYLLGKTYHEGKSVPVDFAEAERWIRKSAESGYPPALCYLGLLYEQGDGVALDTAVAMKYYKKAAELGDTGAKDRLEEPRWEEVVQGVNRYIGYPAHEEEQWRAALWIFYDFIAGLLLVGIPYSGALLLSGQIPELRQFMSWMNHEKYSYSIIVMLPAIQGFISGFRTSRVAISFSTALGMSVGIWFLDSIAALFIAAEGVICLLMALPLFVTVILAFFGLGRFVGKKLPGKTLRASMIPLVFLAVAHDATGPVPDFMRIVPDQVIIQAPPEVVWRYVVQYPENDKPPEYWLWKIGLPEPIQSVATAKAVGAARECRFTRNVVFKEKITELVPNKLLTFDVTEQPKDPEIIGHFKLEKGQMKLDRNPDGSTTITATSWYHLYVSPAFYFDWWAADIVRNVHFRVLGHIKSLAEADYRKQQ